MPIRNLQLRHDLDKQLFIDFSTNWLSNNVTWTKDILRPIQKTMTRIFNKAIKFAEEEVKEKLVKVEKGTSILCCSYDYLTKHYDKEVLDKLKANKSYRKSDDHYHIKFIGQVSSKIYFIFNFHYAI